MHGFAAARPGRRNRERHFKRDFGVRDLEKTFGSVVAARDISVSVPPLQTVGIIGANGAGKTTFVNMITGHLPSDERPIQFEGRDITGLLSPSDHAARHLALVPGGAGVHLADRVREHARRRRWQTAPTA